MFSDQKRRSNKIVEIPDRDLGRKLKTFFSLIKCSLSWLFKGSQYFMMLKFLLITILLLIWGLEEIFGIHILHK